MIKTMKLAMAATAATLVMTVPQTVQAKSLTQAEKAGEALAISNVMGLYSMYVISNRWEEIGDLFALDDPDVHQNVPWQMEGPAVREYFETRAAQEVEPGTLHQHSFLAPIIEVAGDGQTAKGVWDSPGIDTGSGNTMAKWAWVRYAIDFKKTDAGWKIWHMKVMPVWRAEYGPAWSEMVQQATNGEKTGGAPDADAAASAAPASPPASAGGPGVPRDPPSTPPGASVQKWRYSGGDLAPLMPENPPKPYETFDPADAY